MPTIARRHAGEDGTELNEEKHNGNRPAVHATEGPSNQQVTL